MAEKNAGIINELKRKAERLRAKAKKHDEERAKYDDAAASVQKAIDALKAAE